MVTTSDFDSGNSSSNLGVTTIMKNYKIEKLLAGEIIISKEPGNSMTPILQSRQPVELTPITWDKVDIGDIVYCKVKGKYYTHLVIAKNEKRGVQIGNNHGYVNGWTKNVYGKVTKIIS
jgi:hypothetical protein